MWKVETPTAKNKNSKYGGQNKYFVLVQGGKTVVWFC
jgi:hypothetical protein